MKHSVRVTGLLLLVFFLAQLNGFFVLDYYIDLEQSALTGETVVNEAAYATSNITPPEVTDESLSFVYVLIALFVGTLLILLIVKFKQRHLWKLWFFLSVVVTLVLSLNTWVFRIVGSYAAQPFFLYTATVVLCCIFAYYKIFRHNVFMHNFTEIFIYGGLAALLVPILNFFSICIILVIVALYDMYAVWKSKHMVAMAEFQTAENVFAGISIPYDAVPGGKRVKKSTRKMSAKNVKKKGSKKVKHIAGNSQQAILGGGDIAFPLLFSGVVLKMTGSFLAAIILAVTTTVALALLFYIGEKGKYYPALPFVAAGCFLGYALLFV